MSGYYPLMLDLENREVVIVGGGVVGERKAATLLESDAEVKIISLEFTSGLKNMEQEEKRLELFRKKYEKGDLGAAVLAFIACPDEEVIGISRQEAHEKNILLNVVDNPSECDFIVPARVRRGDLVISISTSGKSPAFAKKQRRKLEENFPEECGEYMEILGEIREKILETVAGQENRKHIFKALVDSELFEKYCAGEISDLRGELEKILSDLL